MMKPAAVVDQLRMSVRDRYGPMAWFQPAWRAIAAEVGVDKGAFLDLKARSGWTCIHVAAGKPELDAIGLEDCEGWRALADRNRERRLNCTFKAMDPREISYPDATFDAALAVGVAQHWDDAAAVLTELHRVLKPGARLLIYDPVAGGDVPADWVVKQGFAWPPGALVQRWLSRNGMDAAAWDGLKATIKASPFGGGEEGKHGFFRRIVLKKA
jgi:SAM-dependent methyltransferase